MEPQPDPAPLIVIVGETASGKTALAIELAKQFNGEIIAADSRTVYEGMDIGTAKPTLKERGGIPHHLIDVVSPNAEFTAADFKKLANEKIVEIARRNKLPFIVGGTGLYVDSVLFDFDFRPVADPKLRQELQKLTVEELQQILMDKGLPMPENARNPRHLVRAVETEGVVSRRQPLRSNTLILGLRLGRDKLNEKLAKRIDLMIEKGLIDEIKYLAKRYGWDAPGLQAPGYKTFRQYLEGQSTLEEVRQQLVREHKQLAKRQRTWFKRNKSIHWISKKEEAVELMTTFLNKVYTDTKRSLLQ